MDQITKETLAGKPLPLPPQDAHFQEVTFGNSATMHIWVRVIPWSFDEAGAPMKPIDIDAGKTSTVKVQVGSYALVRDCLQGAFIGVMHIEEGVTIMGIGPSGSLYRPKPTEGVTLLPKPGDIGEIPSPTKDVPLPNDGPPVIVGVGVTPNGNRVVRTQQYRRTSDSLSLAPKEERTISLTTLHGIQDESSDTTTVASSVSASASAGWGPVSASVNSSLDTSQTVSHTYTVSESAQRFDEVSRKNESDKVEMFFSWQLFDIVTVYDQNRQALASLVSARAPAIFMGPYDPGNLPASTGE